jgi:hypothetical protein
MNEEKVKKMLEMRMDGASYKEIGDAFGFSKQNAQEMLTRYMKRLSGTRGKGFNIEDIVYEGLYDYFDSHKDMTITKFNKILHGNKSTHYISKTRCWLTGVHEPTMKLSLIRKICEIVGKPFEEVFRKRGESNGQ